MDKAYIKKNVASCDKYIESFERRIDNAETTGEDVNELKVALKGYQDTRARLMKDP